MEVEQRWGREQDPEDFCGWEGERQGLRGQLIGLRCSRGMEISAGLC